MDNLFLLLFLLSFLALIVFAIRTAMNLMAKNTLNAKRMLKFSSYALIASAISFIGFGLTTDTSEDTQEVAATEAAEQQAASEEQEREDKALEEQQAKQEAAAKAEVEKKAKEEAAAKEAAEKKAKEEAAAKEAAEKKAKAEAEEKARAEEQAKAEAAAKELAEQKANATPIDYAQLKKNPDRYAGEYVTYTGEILQILEGDGLTNIRLAVTETSYGYDINDVIFIEYLGYTDFIDEDIITIYGKVYGAYTYESQAGYTITLPGVLADTVE